MMPTRTRSSRVFQWTAASIFFSWSRPNPVFGCQWTVTRRPSGCQYTRMAPCLLSTSRTKPSLSSALMKSCFEMFLSAVEDVLRECGQYATYIGTRSITALAAQVRLRHSGERFHVSVASHSIGHRDSAHDSAPGGQWVAMLEKRGKVQADSLFKELLHLVARFPADYTSTQSRRVADETRLVRLDTDGDYDH